ncbi:MAG: hypothetical protein EHM28_02335 [Spirochaetaceae bacterium]|nr:MAG: hypothetical protein EHM28_02335 [Spirochaetaceae bacterium]
MGYSVYFWGDIDFSDSTASWRAHKPDGSKWNDWTGDFEGEAPTDFKTGRTVDELCTGFPVFKNRGIGYISITVDPHHVEIHGQYGEDTFHSHARELACIFRSAEDFDEGDALVLHVGNGSSYFEEPDRYEIDDEGYDRICAEINADKSATGAAKTVKPVPKAVRQEPKEWTLLKNDPVKAFEKYGHIPENGADEIAVKFFNTILSDVAGIAEWAFDGQAERSGAKDIFAAEPRWFDLCVKAFKDKRFKEEALAAIKYHPEGVLFIVKNFDKLSEAGVNALYDCYINGPKGKLPMDFLDPLLPLAKENKDLAVFLEKAAKRAIKKKK